MHVKLHNVAYLALVFIGAMGVGCKRDQASTAVDPHSKEGAMRTIMELRIALSNAVKSKDYTVVDERAFYLQGVVKQLYLKLEPNRQKQLEPLVNEIARVAEELDHAAGRRHEGATTASMEKLEVLLKELEEKIPPATPPKV